MALSLPHTIITDHKDTTRNFEVLGPVLEATQVASTSVERKVASLTNTVSLGAWTAFTLSASLEAGGGYEPAARTEANGTVVRFRGIPKVKAGKEVAAGGTLFTLPAGQRPTKTVQMVTATAAGTLKYVTVATDGKTTIQGAIGEGVELFLDGITFSIA